MNGKILYMALLLTVSAAGNESAENNEGYRIFVLQLQPGC